MIRVNTIPDENIFDIKQGVSIVLCIKNPHINQNVKVKYAELWGNREGKYAYLATADISVTKWDLLVPTSPNYFFVPKDITQMAEYKKGWLISDIYPLNTSGIKTHHDNFVIDFELSSLK